MCSSSVLTRVIGFIKFDQKTLFTSDFILLQSWSWSRWWSWCGSGGSGGGRGGRGGRGRGGGVMGDLGGLLLRLFLRELLGRRNVTPSCAA